MRRLLAFAIAFCACDNPEPVAEDVSFRGVLTNPSSAGALSGADILLAPGVWAVRSDDDGLFTIGEPSSAAFEQLAEDGANAPLAEELAGVGGVASSGSFGAERPGDNYEENPIAPGQSVEFLFNARSDERLVLAAMFIHSNDIVIATVPGALSLSGRAVGESVDVTDSIALFDAGTERNEEPGSGPNQPMQQAGPNTGDDENGVVGELDDGFSYPAVPSFVRLTLERLE